MVQAPHQPGGAPLRWSFLDILGAAAGFGVLAGLAEVLVHLVRRLSGRTMFMAPEHVWQVPLANGLVFLGFGVLYALIAVPVRPLRSPRIILGFFGSLPPSPCCSSSNGSTSWWRSCWRWRWAWRWPG